MRLEHYERMFTTIGSGQGFIVADDLPMPDFERVYIAIETTAIAGAPTNFHYDARPKHGSNVLDSQADTIRSADQTAAGTFALDRLRTNAEVKDMSWEVVWPTMRITVEFSGGTNPTVTGIVHIMGRIR